MAEVGSPAQSSERTTKSRLVIMCCACFRADWKRRWGISAFLEGDAKGAAVRLRRPCQLHERGAGHRLQDELRLTARNPGDDFAQGARAGAQVDRTIDK